MPKRSEFSHLLNLYPLFEMDTCMCTQFVVTLMIKKNICAKANA